jgi:two-component system C4-dicarboxylate transport sensor histidine kinase DctB
MPLLPQPFPWKRLWRWAAPLAVFALLVVATGRWAERREIELKTTELQQAAETNTLGLRGIIARHDYLPYAAARHPDISALLRQPSTTALVQKVNGELAALQQASGSAALFLIDANGTTLAASNWAEPGSFVGQSYKRRPYFEDAMQGHRGFFYGLGLTTGVPGLFIAEPVRSADRVIGVTVVKVGLESLAAAWSRSINPVVLQDSRGIVFLSSTPEWLYHSEKPLAADDVAWLTQHSQYGERQSYPPLPWKRVATEAAPESRFTTLLAGREREFLALSTTIPELGWRLTLTGDFAEIRQARHEAQAIAALLSALVVMGFLYWRLREKRQLERDQREKERQLQRTARLASVGEMASTLAHELNQPLMALSNFAMATRSLVGKAPPEMIIASLDDIVQQSKRASEIVRRVRAFINPQRASYEVLDMAGVIAQAIGMLQAELQRSPVAVHTTTAPDLPPVRGDRILLEQVVVNLVQNAIHAQLELPPSERAIDIAATAQDGLVQIAIADHGPGIAPDQKDQLFTPFFSTKAEGLGLGLNICRTIVEAHGGHITVGNRIDGGAVFTITLPSAKQAP